MAHESKTRCWGELGHNMGTLLLVIISSSSYRTRHDPRPSSLDIPLSHTHMISRSQHQSYPSASASSSPSSCEKSSQITLHIFQLAHLQPVRASERASASLASPREVNTTKRQFLRPAPRLYTRPPDVIVPPLVSCLPPPSHSHTISSTSRRDLDVNI